MKDTSLKIRIVLIFTTILALALFLQSVVVIILGVRASIREDVVWAQRFIETIDTSALLTEMQVEQRPRDTKYYDNILEEYHDVFSCVIVEIEGEAVSQPSPCRYQKELKKLSQQVTSEKAPVIGFAGKEWQSNVFGNEMALISVPLVNSVGLVFGSLSVERSLLPIYSRYQRDMGIVLCYLLVNIILFSILGFFRFVRILFRPLDKLVQVAENYHPDEQSLLSFSDDESAFRKLSISLNALLDRIKRDNCKLRNTISELEVANRELTEKKDMVVRSEKLASAGRLSAGLAHEIGNPLSIIQGYVELLGREDLSCAEKCKFSQKAQQELDRIKKLVRQLLDFSRPVQSGEERITVNSLIGEVLSFVSMEKSFADCTVSTDLSTNEDVLMLDKDGLRQVLINILLNALDATAERGGEKEISIATYTKESNQLGLALFICLKDNGGGIDEHNLPHIFDPFFTTKEAGRGTGLGLFVCHTIMERMGGNITIHNLTPHGIEVSIELPLHHATSSRLQ